MMKTNSITEKKNFFEDSTCRKSEFAKISIHSNELSTHSDLKENFKYTQKIFKIQKYVKSGKFENKILSEEEFSEEEILKSSNDLAKKISPFSKVNFSKLRKKEKNQRYFMMKKLVHNLNFKLKKLEKQVAKNPCSLLNKLSKIKIRKMEAFSGIKPRDGKEQPKSKSIDEFKFENLVKAATKLYFYEDFEYLDEKNMLNTLFRLIDSEKFNLNCLQIKKISNILRSIKQKSNLAAFEPCQHKQSFRENESDNKIKEEENLLMDDSNNSNSENEELNKLNLKFKIIDDDVNKEQMEKELNSLNIQITQKDLELLKSLGKRSKEQNRLLSVISNNDDVLSKNINFSKCCELKKINNLNNKEIKLKKNQNNKLNKISIKSEQKSGYLKKKIKTLKRKKILKFTQQITNEDFENKNVIGILHEDKYCQENKIYGSIIPQNQNSERNLKQISETNDSNNIYDTNNFQGSSSLSNPNSQNVNNNETVNNAMDALISYNQANKDNILIRDYTNTITNVSDQNISHFQIQQGCENYLIDMMNQKIINYNTDHNSDLSYNNSNNSGLNNCNFSYPNYSQAPGTYLKSNSSYNSLNHLQCSTNINNLNLNSNSSLDAALNSNLNNSTGALEFLSRLLLFQSLKQNVNSNNFFNNDTYNNSHHNNIINYNNGAKFLEKKRLRNLEENAFIQQYNQNNFNNLKKNDYISYLNNFNLHNNNDINEEQINYLFGLQSLLLNCVNPQQ